VVRGMTPLERALLLESCQPVPAGPACFGGGGGSDGCQWSPSEMVALRSLRELGRVEFRKYTVATQLGQLALRVCPAGEP
jgi:hypothetical protein